MLKNQKGVTLVALVVTIVVLIILATLVINLAFNEDGIVGYAEDAEEYQANAEAIWTEHETNITSYIDAKLPASE